MPFQNTKAEILSYMEKRTLALTILLLIVTDALAQKMKLSPSLHIESGINLNHYKVTLATISSNQQPVLHQAMGNYARLSLSVPFAKRFQGQVLAGFSSERIVSEVTRTESTPLGTLTYPYELNVVQHLADLEIKLSFPIPIRDRVSIVPSLGTGSSLALGKTANSYSYIVPGFALSFDRFGLHGCYKIAHYNVEAVQNSEWFQTAPKQFLVRPRVVQVGFTYKLL